MELAKETQGRSDRRALRSTHDNSAFLPGDADRQKNHNSKKVLIMRNRRNFFKGNFIKVTNNEEVAWNLGSLLEESTTDDQR